MLIYKAILLQTFGRGSNTPFRTALLRLGCMAAGALGLGILFAWGMQNIPIMPIQRMPAVFFGSAFATQLAVTLTLYASAGFGDTRNHDTFARLLLSWPLKPVQRSVALLLPACILAGLALMLVGPALSVATLHLGLPLVLLPLCIGLGVCSAFGLLYGKLGNVACRLAVIAAAAWGEYKLIQMMLTDTQHHAMIIVALCLTFTALIALSVHSFTWIAKNISRPSTGKNVHADWLPQQFWHIKKILRSRTAMVNFAIGILLSIGIAMVALHQGIADWSMLGMFGALLSGSFVSDLRALARRYQPAEITALRGTRFFMVAQTCTACVCSLAIALPLAWRLPVQDLLLFMAQIVLGISAGLLAGTLIVPEPRDVMGQFLALLLVLGVLTGLPQLPVVSKLSTASQTTLSAGIALLLLAGALVMEYKRNNYIWRKSYTP